jgi:hypothetical protein
MRLVPGMARAAIPIRKARSREIAFRHIVLCRKRQNAVVYRADFDALRFVKIAFAFGAGSGVDFKYDGAFADGSGRADRLAVAAGNAVSFNYIQGHG